MNLTEIRQKYPQYDDMDDAQFASSFHDKFYSDMTEEEFNQKIGMTNTQKGDPFEEAAQVPQWGRDNPRLYGVAGAARETLGPLVELGGLAGGSAVGFGAGGPVGAAAGGTLGYGSGRQITSLADQYLGNKPMMSLPEQASEVGEDLKTGAMLEFGGQSLGPIIKGAWNNGGKQILSSVGDVATGMGNETIKRLTSAGFSSNPLGQMKSKLVSALRGTPPAKVPGNKRLESATNNMRGGESMEAVVGDARKALKNMVSKRSAQYLDDMAQVEQANSPLNFKLVDDAYNDLTKSLKIGDTWKVGKETQAKMYEIEKTIRIWRLQPELHTTIGFDALKQRINDLMPSKTDGGQSGRAVTKMYNAIKDTIVRESPKYGEAMKSFERSINQTKAIETELSLGKNAAEGTTLRKLQSITRNNANTNYGNRESMAKALEEQGGADILDRVAGQAANSWTPRGLSRINPVAGAAFTGFNPSLLPLLAATSPRIVGEGAVKAGQLAKLMKQFSSYAPPMSAVTEGAYVSDQERQRLAEQLRNR